MYAIEYLPLALEDLKEIVYYITCNLKNPAAAENLGQEIIKKINLLAKIPYSSRYYRSVKALFHEYRKLLVKNYFVFYWVNEAQGIQKGNTDRKMILINVSVRIFFQSRIKCFT